MSLSPCLGLSFALSLCCPLSLYLSISLGLSLSLSLSIYLSLLVFLSLFLSWSLQNMAVSSPRVGSKSTLVTVAVVGLTSSSLGDQGEGAGKSCLCNGFVWPHAGKKKKGLYTSLL